MDLLDKLFDKLPYDRLHAIQPKHRWAGIAGICLLLLLIVYLFFIQGSYEKKENLENELTKIERKIDENKKHIERRGKLEIVIAKLEEDLAIAKQQLPTEQEIPEILEEISNTGTDFDLEFLTFRPKPEQRKEYYAEVPVSLKMVGSFHDMLKFYDVISMLPRIVTIDNIKMSTLDKGKGANRTSGDIEMECQAVTYRYVEGGELPVGKTGKK